MEIVFQFFENHPNISNKIIYEKEAIIFLSFQQKTTLISFIKASQK